MPVSSEVQANLKQSIRSCTTEQLIDLNNFIVNRIKANRRESNYSAISALSVGHKVITAAVTRPTKFASLRGTVISIRQTKVVVEIEKGQGFPDGFRLTCPASSLTIQ